MSRPSLGYAHSRLVRHSAERTHAALPDPSDPRSGHVLIAGDRIVLGMDQPATALLAAADRARAPQPGLAVFLGRVDDRPVFASALPEEGGQAFAEPAFRLIDLRALAAEGTVPADELGLLATAKSVLTWHARNRFCANCGTPTEIGAAGFRRDCPACAAHHFPRTDPVVIMLIRRGEACLLGRAPHFREGMYSCLAGFLEPGETIEDAVRRETMEEVGIAIGPVRYHASQPWPFPSSLMIGCVADADSETIALDPVELADARWFGRAEIGLMIAGRHPDGVTVPPPTAIAHLLMRDFCDGLI